jgi:hypothetical protein
MGLYKILVLGSQHVFTCVELIYNKWKMGMMVLLIAGLREELRACVPRRRNLILARQPTIF